MGLTQLHDDNEWPLPLSMLLSKDSDQSKIEALNKIFFSSNCYHIPTALTPHVVNKLVTNVEQIKSALQEEECSPILRGSSEHSFEVESKAQQDVNAQIQHYCAN